MDKFNTISNYVKSIRSFEIFLKTFKKEIVFLCVGNSNVWYDSFGPIVGALLKNKYNTKNFVYGSIDNNIKLSNLNEYIRWVKTKHIHSKIVVIDAAISNRKDSKIVFKKGSTKCAYYSDQSEEIGDYSILCPIIDVKGKDKYFKKIISNALIVSEMIDNYI